ncbi:unnamed protein product [Ilex paraguariensis]|uniref:Uncharacterized protein n=1 Tax=Ilex paraguariensis TaxID=185542 RepID=A0ABC8SW61_9AQUA
MNHFFGQKKIIAKPSIFLTQDSVQSVNTVCAFGVSRCRLWEKEVQIKEMKEQLNELVNLLGQREIHKKEIVKEQKHMEQVVAVAMAMLSSVRLYAQLSVVLINGCTVIMLYSLIFDMLKSEDYILSFILLYEGKVAFGTSSLGLHEFTVELNWWF